MNTNLEDINVKGIKFDGEKYIRVEDIVKLIRTCAFNCRARGHDMTASCLDAVAADIGEAM